MGKSGLLGTDVSVTVTVLTVPEDAGVRPDVCTAELLVGVMLEADDSAASLKLCHTFAKHEG